MAKEQDTPKNNALLYKGLIYLFLILPLLMLWFSIFVVIIARMFEDYSGSYTDIVSLLRFIVQTGMNNTNFLVMFSAFIIFLFLIEIYKRN